jgi:hypothetical protein
VDPVAVRLARRKTECWANVSQCPVYVDTGPCRQLGPYPPSAQRGQIQVRGDWILNP